ncbi:helix-turn-helix domain containing protein [Enterococcus dispar]
MKNWTTKEIQYLKKNALLAETNEVLNIKEMANKLNRTTQSVRNKIYNLQRDGDLPKVNRELAIDSFKRPWIPEEDKRLLAMRKQGATHSEIAVALGRTEIAVGNRVARLMKSKRTTSLAAKWTEEKIQLLIDNISFDENGYVSNYDDLSRLTGMKYSQVQGKVTRLRNSGRINIFPIKGTTSIKSKNAMNRFNDARFAHIPKKKEEVEVNVSTENSSDISIESKQVNLILTTVCINGQRTEQYYLPNGDLLVIKKTDLAGKQKVSQ